MKYSKIIRVSFESLYGIICVLNGEHAVLLGKLLVFPGLFGLFVLFAAELLKANDFRHLPKTNRDLLMLQVSVIRGDCPKFSILFALSDPAKSTTMRGIAYSKAENADL